MKMKQFMPEFKTIKYNLLDSGIWYKSEPQLIPFKKLPEEVKIEETQDKKINAPFVITSHVKGGKYEFFTGLQPINNQWYLGNHAAFKNGK